MQFFITRLQNDEIKQQVKNQKSLVARSKNRNSILKDRKEIVLQQYSTQKRMEEQTFRDEFTPQKPADKGLGVPSVADYKDNDIDRIQKQHDLHKTLAKQSIVVQADPKILIKGNHPSFMIVEDPINSYFAKSRESSFLSKKSNAPSQLQNGLKNKSRIQFMEAMTLYESELLNRKSPSHILGSHAPRSQSVDITKRQLVYKNEMKKKRQQMQVMGEQNDQNNNKITLD